MKRKFVNKKTGAEARVMAIYLDSDGVMQVDGYDAVEDLMDDYAAYEEYNPPKGPLIKDEKVRAIFKMWASNFKNVMTGNTFTFYVDKEYQSFMANLKPTSRYSYPDVAELDLNFDYGDLEDGKDYTFDELCGEEEE